jgi:endonuclease YncB( thermonuclease family)
MSKSAMKLRPLLVPAILLTVSGGLFAWLLLADPPQPSDKSAANTGLFAKTAPGNSAHGTATGTPGDLAGRTQAPAAPNPDDIRDVSPEGVTAPSVSGGLKRVEPSERYLELKNPPIEEIPNGPLELRRVQVLDSGHIKSERLTVKLAHIDPLTLDETCLSRLGGSWPCGTRARTFLRGLIRQFKITCEKIEDLGPHQILASCHRGKIDLGARLVRYGWADPALDAPDRFKKLAQTAKEKKIGKWQSEWLNDLPVSDWENRDEPLLSGLEDLAPEIVEWSLRSDLEQSPEDLLAVEDEVSLPPPSQ